MGTTIASYADLGRVEGYASMQEFLDAVDDQTDMEVVFTDAVDALIVEHFGGGQPDQFTFTYPFDSDDLLSWVYHVENDNSVRYELADDVEALLDDAGLEESNPGAYERALAFVEWLLRTRRVDVDGTDFVPMGADGLPIEWTAAHFWVTPTRGGIARPFRPLAHEPAVAKLYPDGRLALAWADSLPVPDSPAVRLVLPDVLVVDLGSYNTTGDKAGDTAGDTAGDGGLPKFEELYDTAYEHYWSQRAQAEPPGGD